MVSGIESRIKSRKQENGDYLADILIDICFVTSYKVEDLLSMPPRRLNRIIERYKERFCKEK